MGHEAFLREAIELARSSVRSGGGPFGALVVRGGRVVGRGTNRVVADRDPSAHAEIVAIREAARTLGTHVLAGARLYASCEPCPMCAAACLWARIDAVHHACGRGDAAAAGFDDERILEEVRRPPAERSVPFAQALRDEGLRAFEDWAATPDRVPY